MVRSIGDRAFVRCTEVVRFSESPLLEVSLYMYTIDGRVSRVVDLTTGLTNFHQKHTAGLSMTPVGYFRGIELEKNSHG